MYLKFKHCCSDYNLYELKSKQKKYNAYYISPKKVCYLVIDLSLQAALPHYKSLAINFTYVFKHEWYAVHLAKNCSGHSALKSH